MRIKEIARLVTQALKEPALENTIARLGSQAVDSRNQAAEEGITGKMVIVEIPYRNQRKEILILHTER